MAVQDDDDTVTHVDLTPGTLVSHYRIVEKIGAGGMGEVYLAEDSKLHRRVALKFLTGHLASDREIRIRFTREAQAAAKLNHPNVITIYEVSEFNGRPFFAMEYVTGQSLGHHCREKKLSINDIVTLAIQICDGLGKAHQLGIVHRDIKPTNIVIDSDGRAKILDFGLAAVQGADTLTKTGSTLGTIAYMSPEQAQGKALDQRSDIFSFGVVLYELVTGQAPFKRDNDAATIHAIVSEQADPMARFRANVPDELQRIVSKLLERDPGLRYQTASDVVADLKKLAISGSQPPARPAGARGSHFWKYVGAIGVIGAALVVFLVIRAGKGVDSPTKEMTITPITSEGNVTTAAISKDGNYVAYATDDGGRQRVWIQRMASGGRVQIVDTTNAALVNMSFSTDGNFVYYRLISSGDMGDLYRVPVLGGSSHQVSSNVWSNVTFSPNGARMAFWRVSLATMSRAVVTANADGTGEGELTAQVEGVETYFSNYPAWSPDGKVIAISRGSAKGSTQTVLAMLDSTSGKEVSQISGNWVGELSVGWLPVGGLIVAATHHSNPFGRQIWQVAYPEGTLKRVTNDLNDYREVSLTADGKRLAVVQTDIRAGVWLVRLSEPDHSTQILTGKYDGLGGVSWVDSSSLVFFTRTANDFCLSRYFVDRGTQEVVMRGNPIVFSPSVSRDGHKMAYFDAGEQYSRISVCDLDGRNRRSLTENGEPSWPDISSDGDWAVYCDFAKGYPRAIRTSLKGDSVQFVETDSTAAQLAPCISPDGRWIACFRVALPRRDFQLAILPSEGGSPAHLFEIPQSLEDLELAWTADGSSILYQQTKNGVSNVWSQSIEGGAPRQLTFFKELHIDDFDLSFDGKTLAVCRSKSASDVVLIEGF